MGWWWFRIVSAHLFDDHADRSNNHLVGGHTVRYVADCALTKGDLRRLARVVDVDLRSQVLLRRPSKI